MQLKEDRYAVGDFNRFNTASGKHCYNNRVMKSSGEYPVEVSIPQAVSTVATNELSILVDSILWECYRKGINPKALFQFQYRKR